MKNLSHPLQNPSRLVTVRHQRLSLWQSAAEEMLMTNPPDGSAPCTTLLEARSHRVMAGVNRHVKIRAAGAPVPPPDDGPATALEDTSLHAYVSHLHFEMAEARRTNDQARLDALLASCQRYYATCDTAGWASCETTYLAYMASTGDTLQYNDWTVAGNNDLQYGVIEWTVPSDGAVAIIGDWGTGLPDAEALVQELMMLTKPPSAIIHLGDIYYAGTPSQCSANFAAILAAAAPGVPVFTIPGNHDYYDWGVGFYQMLPGLNPATATQLQQASYFCLRTSDGLWQFLGADTGEGDTSPLDELSPSTGPALRPTEVTWHQDKLANFGGSTILLTHHQFFSANSAINGATGYPPYINMFLGHVFAPYFNRISAWLWGHEHNIALFENGLFGLSMGRLIGSSAYEEATSDAPYVINYPQVPFNQNIEFQAVNGFYPHACAVIDFERAQPSDPITITYYQTPSWYETVPDPLPGLTPILTENINPAT
jgi:hypothetical protein